VVFSQVATFQAAQPTMDTLFFLSSKFIWALLSPDSLLLIMGVGAWLATVARWHQLARRLVSIVALAAILIGFLPVGEWLLAPLENRFPSNVALPPNATGIIVLGGAISPTLSATWNQPELNDAADRLTSFAYLSSLYPNAQLVFTGGNGSMSQQDYPEADSAQILFDQLGLSDKAVLFESQSRNTIENVRNSKRLVQPKPEDAWILVTSAYHMPRSVGVFCKNAWPITPYPVDHRTLSGQLLRVNYDLSGNLSLLSTAVREWLGLIAYRASGQTSDLLPADGNCN
jgi:uncharacterized SAM-binding protein YcdF (DUF218 family)